jgi:UDP-N-acetylglucosamine 1-carboxyvinyltransferase
MTVDDFERIGSLLRDARRHRGWALEQAAGAVGVDERTLREVEAGRHHLSLDLVARIGRALDAPVEVGGRAASHLRVAGGRPLTGSIDVRTSKNASVALLCASLLTTGRTRLRRIARIEEVDRMVEVLQSVGVGVRWIGGGNDIELTPPDDLDLDGLDVDAARRTRSALLLLAPLLHRHRGFRLPYAGGCDLGTRTVNPHLAALRPFGLDVTTGGGLYQATVTPRSPDRPIVLIERGDTVTENALMAAARHDGIATIRNASSNYMVQDLCHFLVSLGVKVEGIGTTTLTVHGVPEISGDIDYTPSEDPIEAMSLLAAGISTSSEISIRRVPIEFLEVELALLEEMGLRYRRSREYPGANGSTRLVDLDLLASELRSPADKVHPMPFPGLNIDNLPFFALVAACSTGSTLIHDWVYDNRAIYLTELRRLGAQVSLLDPHRVQVAGPTRWRAAEVGCPPALRPAVVLLLAMLAAPGQSVLRNDYVVRRGYEQLADRLNGLGAEIEPFSDR